MQPAPSFAPAAIAVEKRKLLLAASTACCAQLELDILMRAFTDIVL
jgi:hypothetical protein